MSQEEQDRLIGQAFREKAEVARKLALIAYELDRLREGLTAIGNELHRRANLAGAHPELSIPEAVGRYMDCSKLLALLDEQKQLIDKRASLSRAIE